MYKRLQDLSPVAYELFLCLESRKWKDAETVIKKIQTSERPSGEDRMRGYVYALQGMLTVLREKDSSLEPFLLTLGNSPKNRLKTLKKKFYDQGRRNLNADYDRGFFIAWYEYIKFLIDKVPHNDEV